MDELSPSALANFPFTFVWSHGANKIYSVTVHYKGQKYYLLHRDCDGAAILVPDVKYKVVEEAIKSQ